MPKIALRVIYFKLVKCIMIRIHYSVFRIMLRPEIVRMSYLALTEKEVGWRGKTKDSGVFYHLLL